MGFAYKHWPLGELELGGLEPVGRVVVDQAWREGDRAERWVVAIAVENPFRHVDRADCPDDSPAQLIESELLICDIGHWHRLDDGPRTYRLTSAEWAWTSSGLVVYVRGEWDDDDFERRLRRRFTAPTQPPR